MQSLALPETPDTGRGPLVSVALHVLVICVLAVVVPQPKTVTTVDIPVSVEIIAASPAARPEAAPLQPPLPTLGNRANSPISRLEDRKAAIPWPSAQVPLAGPEASPMTRPERMLSKGALADPRSSAARRELRFLAADERAIQLCNIEAMEQVHAWKKTFVPEAVVAYATKELKIRGGSIDAEGAAFYSTGSWYRLGFECEVRGDEVVSFAYSVGEAIPRATWEEHNLPERAQDEDG